MGSFVYRSHVTDTTYLDHPNAIDQDSNFLYIGGYDGLGQTRFSIWDISNPISPVRRGVLNNAPVDYGGSIYSLKKLGNYCYCAARSSSAMTIFDVSNPDNPSYVNHIGAGQCVGVDVRAQYAFISAYSGWWFKIYDVSTPASPILKGTITNIFQPGRLAIDPDGQYAFLIWNNNSLRVIDVSDVNNPVLKGTVVISDIANSLDSYIVKVDQNYVYVTGINNLTCVEITDKNNPTVRGSISTGLQGPTGLTVDGMNAYVANWSNNQGISKFNITNQYSLVYKYGLTGTGNHMDTMQALAQYGEHLYIGNAQNNELVVVEDLSDKVGPSSGITIVPGTEKNTVSWDKFELEPFDDLDDWTVYNKGAGGTATIVSGKVRLTVTDADSHVQLKDNTTNPIHTGDFDISIDIADYQPNDSDDSLDVYLRVKSASNDDNFQIFYSERGGRHISRAIARINAGAHAYCSVVDLNYQPTKFRIARYGNDLHAWVHVGSWYHMGYIEFSSYAANITEVEIFAADRLNTGGYVEFDNLQDIKTDHIYWDVSRGVSTSSNKIEDETTGYEHLGLTPALPIYYKMAGENEEGEGDLSDEYDGTPLPIIPSTPTIGTTSPEIEKNTITWESYTKEEFNNLDDWTVVETNGAGETATIVSDTLRIDLPDSSDTKLKLRGDNNLPFGDFDLTVDIVNYVPDDPGNNGFLVYLRVTSEDYNDDLFQLYYADFNTHTCRAHSTIQGVSEWQEVQNLAATPSKLRIKKLDTVYIAYAYVGTDWVLIGSKDMSGIANPIIKPGFLCQDRNNRGGYVDFDNLQENYTHNVYWKKDKVPNSYFDSTTDVDNWEIITEQHGTEIALIDNGELVLDVPDGIDGKISIKYDYGIPSEDFGVTIDISNYSWDSTDEEPTIACGVRDEDNSNFLDILYSKYDTNRTRIAYKINDGSIVYDTIYHLGGIPEKLRITRTGNSIQGEAYYEGSWTDLGTIDFSSYFTIHYPLLYLQSRDSHGGLVAFDNMIVTPSVKDSGTKIAGVTTPYEHTSLDGGHIYCYEVTSEGSESEPSQETYGSPEAHIPGPPQNLDTTADIERIIISWEDSTGQVDQYNVYWDTTAGVTSGTGTLISDVVSPYVHSDLDPSQVYYYVITAENATGESSESEEVYNSPIYDFPGPPQNIDTTADFEDITISWEDSTGYVDRYNIYWDTTSGVTMITGIKVTDVTSPYMHIGLTPGNTYYYIITAENDTGETASLEVFKSTLPPAPPINVDATADLEKITILWDDVSYADSYNLYWDTTTGVTTITGTKITSATSPYIHQPLSPFLTYYYIVTTVVNGSESIKSNEVSETPLSLLLDPVQNVDATADLLQVTITWDDLPGADTYNIYWSNSTGVTKYNGNKIENVTSPYVHITPSHMIPFYYIVTGVNISGEGQDSAEVSAIPLLPPYGVPDQDRTIDSFSLNRFSSKLTKIIKMVTLGEDFVLFPGQSFGMTIDSTHEMTLGRGMFIKDNTFVHIQDTFTLDFSDNDYYVDSTGSMEEAGYYYIVIEYEYKRQRSGPRASYRIIRDVDTLWDSDIYLFLGTAQIVLDGGEYKIDNVYTYDPLFPEMRRPTRPSIDSIVIDAGEI